MILKHELDELLSRGEDAESPVLSVYLNVNQGQMENLNRGFETALKNVLREAERRSAENGARKEFQSDAEEVVSFIRNYVPSGRTLVAFCDVSSGYFWHKSLRVPLDNQAQWLPAPYLRPLIEARDEFERYAVVLTDRAHARMFIVFFDEVEEHREVMAEDDVKHFDASGKDRIWSQMSNQRKSDQHASAHLKNVADIMDHWAEEKRFDRLLIGGPADAQNELEKILSERLKKRLIGTLTLAVDAPEHDVIAAATQKAVAFERAYEMDLVDRLITAAAKNGQAVRGIEETLTAATEGRIRSLVYAQGYQAAGGRCTQCHVRLPEQPEQCPHCSGGVTAEPDLVEYLVSSVARTGGAVEQVRQEASDRLSEEAAGIAAFLRF